MLLRLALLTAVVLAAAPASAQQYDGQLEPTDQVHQSGSYMDLYEFDALAGQQVDVDLRSDAFDAYLIVVSPSGQEHVNDDFGEGHDARVSVLAMEEGTWTVQATSYASDAQGDYTVVITKGDRGEVERREGRLDPRDATALKGEYVDTHELSLDGEGRLILELLSYGFDGYLVVDTPAGERLRNDDAGSTTLSRIGPLPAQPGTYTVYVTSLSPDEYGAYDLRVIRMPEE